MISVSDAALKNLSRRTGYAEEVLLFQAEFLALVGVIVRIEHAGDILGKDFLL